MRGHFSLKHDPYTGLVHFGNLVGDDEYTFAVACGRESMNGGQIIAHDVVEHSLAHRRKRHVRIEEELRALGAIVFVRAADITTDILMNIAYMRREMDEVPWTMRRYIDDNLGPYIEFDDLAEKFESEADGELSEDLWAKTNYHVRWGQLLKEWQFDGDQSAAWNAFHFVKQNSERVLKDILWHESYGASVYFDSEHGDFRWRHKRYLS